MSKIRKRKLRWKGSNSPQVVGYKLYWEVGDKVTYDSSCALLGTATEVILPDDVDEFIPVNGSIEFGITAVDEIGNESDLVTISAPYQFSVPAAPGEIFLDDPEKSTPQIVRNEPPAESLEESKEDACELDPELDPLAFLEREFEDENEAIVHRLPDNVVGHHSSENQHDLSMALKQQVDKL